MLRHLPKKTNKTLHIDSIQSNQFSWVGNESSCSSNIQHLIRNIPNSAVYHEMRGSYKAEWNNNKFTYNLAVSKRIAANIFFDRQCLHKLDNYNYVRNYTLVKQILIYYKVYWYYLLLINGHKNFVYFCFVSNCTY